jgi:hypothetical protein
MYVQTSPPVVREAAIVLRPGGFDMVVSGYSPTRELTRALFRFTAEPGGILETTELSVPLRTVAGGSQFTYRQSFTFPGGTPSLGAVSVQLENTIGTSDELTIR